MINPLFSDAKNVQGITKLGKKEELLGKFKKNYKIMHIETEFNYRNNWRSRSWKRKYYKRRRWRRKV